MNKFIIVTVLILTHLFNASVVNAQFMDSSFTYQGELLDNGVPANGQYDINIDLIDGDLMPWGNTSVHSAVNVVNGLFTVNADFGIDSFDGFKDFTITVSIRKTSEGGAFTALGSQTIQAVPLATNLTNGNASTGQVLTFNGFQWAPQTPSVTPWSSTANGINYLSNVGIGGVTNSNTRLYVKTDLAWTASFEGGSQMYVDFVENGAHRGYVGSFVTGNNINDEDFEIGTHSVNSVGSLHFSIQNDPQMTITNSKHIGIGTTTPNSDLQIDATTDGDVLRARIDGTTRFYVDDNGGVGIGAYNTPPTQGMRVQGDVAQSFNSSGMIKYMVHANCNNTFSNIMNAYNGVGDNIVTTIANGSSTGKCILDFGTDISGKFFQVSAVGAGTGVTSRSASCSILSGLLHCARVNVSTGAGTGGQIMVFIY